MLTIPVINCSDFIEVGRRLKISQELLSNVPPHDRWIHIDVADGTFTKGYTTWRNAGDLANIKLDPNIKLEIHLMVNEPEQALDAWFALGISRLIFHLETTASLEVIVAACHSKGVEPMLALSPETTVPHALPYIAGLPGCQLLAVHPGPAGQPFQEPTLEKVKTLRQRFPELIIEVDGGVTLETAPKIKAAGASQIVAGSSIFEAEDPVAVFKKYLEL